MSARYFFFWLSLLVFFFANILIVRLIARMELQSEMILKRLETVEFMLEVKNAN